MVSEWNIPQELIDKIIDQLHADRITLKACSIVSHSFLHPCRKHLFFSIDLSRVSSSQVHTLCNILKTQPGIGSLIRELYIYLGGDEMCDWIMEDSVLPNILEMTPHLQMISLNGRVHPSFIVWQFIPIRVQSAILIGLQSPNLTEVRINTVGVFPSSIFSSLSHVRRLRLKCTRFYTSKQSPPPSPSTFDNLEALELHFSPRLKSIILPQKLRLLAVNSTDEVTLSNAQDVISSSASSIKAVILPRYSAGSSPMEVIKLGIIKNLEILVFRLSLSQGPDEPAFTIDLASIVRRFEDGVSEALKNVTINVMVSDYAKWRDALKPLLMCQEWGMLDEVLCNRCFGLRQVHITIDWDTTNVDPPNANGTVNFLMPLQLPRLAERGILSIGFGNIRDDTVYFDDLLNNISGRDPIIL